MYLQDLNFYFNARRCESVFSSIIYYYLPTYKHFYGILFFRYRYLIYNLDPRNIASTIKVIPINNLKNKLTVLTYTKFSMQSNIR